MAELRRWVTEHAPSSKRRALLAALDIRDAADRAWALTNQDEVEAILAGPCDAFDDALGEESFRAGFAETETTK